LVELLVEKGYQVRALSQYNSFNNWGWLEDIDCLDSIELITGDIRDPFFCNEITKGVDIIFHLAALIAIPYSYIAPQSYVDTNINGTLNMCQAALDNGNIRIIHTSTSEVYGTANYVPIDEKHPLQPQSPYSATKIAADAIAMSFFNSFDLCMSIARPFNTYGPRQSARAVIPTIISQLAAGAKEIKIGDTKPTRDFNFVKDVCEGFIAIGESSETLGEVVNIGSNFEISIGDTIRKIMNIMNIEAELVEESERIRPKKSEVFRLWCDNRKIEELTGYKPRTNIDDGLKKTISWFLSEKNLAKYKSHIYNV